RLLFTGHTKYCLPAVEFAGAEMTSLHFVEQQQQITLVAKASQPDQVLLRGDGDTAFSLNRLDQDSCCLRRNCAPYGFQIIERNVLEAADHRFKALFNFLLTSSGDAGERSSMERA